MVGSQRQEDSLFSVDASNAQVYERRLHERRHAQTDGEPVTKPRRESSTTEVWWVIAAYVMMAAAFVAVLLVK